MHGCESENGDTTSSANTDDGGSPKFGVLGDAITSDAGTLPESVSSPKSPPFAQADLNVISQSLSSRNFLRKCPKVPGSRLTILAQMRRMALQPLNPEDVVKYTNCDTQVGFGPFSRFLVQCKFEKAQSEMILGVSR